MDFTDEQVKAAFAVYFQHSGEPLPSFRAAIESLPEPLPRLRPLSEMPAEAPEGAVRLTGYIDDEGDWCIGNFTHEKDTHGLLALPPLPEPAKPDSLQDELVRALEAVASVWTEQNDGKFVDAYYISSARNMVREAIAKAKGGQQ